MIEFYDTDSRGNLAPAIDKPLTFPAGEQHIVDASVATEPHRPAAVIVRGTDMNEYALAAMWLDLCARRDKSPALLVPYLPGARQDRGRPFGAKVYADLIATVAKAGASKVICFDPHSPVMPNLIDDALPWEIDLIAVDSVQAVRDGIEATGLIKTLAGVICPDHGAIERTTRVANALGVPMFKAEKHRDFATGKLSGFTCEPLPDEGILLVVDDICDGGGTFRGLADATGLPKERLALFVSHGVFSGAAPGLRENYSQIITTDSHPGHNREGVATHILPVLPYLIAALDHQALVDPTAVAAS